MIYILVCKVAELPDPLKSMPKPSDQQLSDFYVRLGMAIAAWQFVESNLINVYAIATKSFGQQAVAASFHVPTSFKIRLDMTNEAVMRSGSSQDLIDEWGKLYKRLRAKGDRRNKIAHSVVIWQPQRKNPNKHLFLAASPQDPIRATSTEFNDAEIITQNDLENLMKAFSDLENDISTFYRKLGAQLMPPPASPST
jgi:hypothetical protein